MFAQQRSKKTKNQKAKPTASGQTAATGAKRDDDKKDEPTKASQQQDFAESSDEETKIELDEKTAVIKDSKEVEATKRKENEKEQQDRFGWAGLDKKSNQPSSGKIERNAPPSKANAPMDVDSLKASVSGKPADIKFNKGPQQFSNKTKS